MTGQITPDVIAEQEIRSQRVQALTINAQMLDIYQRTVNRWEYILRYTGIDEGKPIPPQPVTVDEEGIRAFYNGQRPTIPAPVNLRPDWHVFEREGKKYVPAELPQPVLPTVDPAKTIMTPFGPMLRS
jgi:hypothetical protein